MQFTYENQKIVAILIVVWENELCAIENKDAKQNRNNIAF
jgi:hypothetical protein